ncbi:MULTISPECIES: PAS domain-containing sensor histidine kinase [Rhodopseudomonas]|uniref:hybrid sensor histidine kinase/response regulator n=1 Tax=Rhodopseudomonas TaxID=1073 RepID=UPI0006968265|nr:MULTISPECIES: PAS domain-containing sensor histidine kinase [Rhodopseudomonas]MDF3814111.1 PAS domain S-box protein [Rhodopseudomonas sp. BAL398]WOK19624.1 PAS domain S-box protein [Rhodopseudomonas sp. BAL398]
MIQEQPEANWLQATPSATIDGILLIDSDESIQLFNQACEKLFGYAPEEAIGQNVRLLLPAWSPDWLERIADYPTSTEHGRRKDGTIFPMELSMGRTRLDGKPVFVCVTRDLTEGHRVHQATRESERNYRLLVEGVTDYAIYMLDVGGHVTSWNSGAKRIKQFGAEEILGQHFSRFYTEEALQRGEPEANLEIARRTGHYEAKGWRRRKDGSQFWAHVVIEPLMNEYGELIGFAKVTSDISEGRRVELAVSEADERINALIETMVDGVILIDAEGTIQTFNRACQTLFGYAKEEVIGHNVKMLMPTEYREAHDGYLGNYHRTGVRKIIGIGREVKGQRKDGSVFPMELSVGETRRDGEPLFVGVIHDLTERKRIEAQLVQAQKMETVGQLSGGIAHDFNNLLTVIVGNAEFLSEQLMARQDLRNLANDIGRAGERGAELTQRLLAFSRRQNLMPVGIDCNELLDSMHKLLRRTLRENITVKANYEPALRTTFADRVQLESAIINIALNAQDAMPNGGILGIATSNVSLDDPYQFQHPEVRPGQYVLLAITDNGDGMSQETLNHAFEPFYTTKDVGKGSGLGLSMVYGFVKQSNGHVAIYSDPGFGTTIRIYLPAQRGDAEASPGQAPIAQSYACGDEVVLVVEDDPFVRSYAVMCLRSLGYIVIAATDGVDALRKLGADVNIDVLFTDVVLPGSIDGFELANLARSQRPDLRVLLTSGYAHDSTATSLRTDDAVLLNKPYRKEDLAQRMRDIVDSGRAPQPVGPALTGR